MVQQPSVLAGAHGTSTPARKQPWSNLPADGVQVGIDSMSGLLCDIEPDRSPGLALLDRRPLNSIAMRIDALDPEHHQVTGAQLAVHCQIEESQVAQRAIKLEARATCPDVLWLERRF